MKKKNFLQFFSISKADYDQLIETHSQLKQSFKKLKLDYKNLEEKLDLHIKKHQELLENKDNVSRMMKSSSSRSKINTIKPHNEERKEKIGVDGEEADQMNVQCDQSPEKQNEEKIQALINENKELSEDYKRLQTEHKMLQNIYKKLRSDNNDLKLKHTELQGETAECKDRMNSLNIEVSKLSNYYEMVVMTNSRLEMQRKKLIAQSASLLTQYNNLLLDLTRGGGGKDRNSFKERLHDLLGKKDRLEKMFKDYDDSFERNMSKRLENETKSMLLDDSIYGLLWEAETPPISSSSTISLTDQKFYNSTALLRQYSINNNIKNNLVN